jgi:hypothetical protein
MRQLRGGCWPWRWCWIAGRDPMRLAPSDSSQSAAWSRIARDEAAGLLAELLVVWREGRCGESWRASWFPDMHSIRRMAFSLKAMPRAAQ